jgi:hypothetical protein
MLRRLGRTGGPREASGSLWKDARAGHQRRRSGFLSLSAVKGGANLIKITDVRAQVARDAQDLHPRRRSIRRSRRRGTALNDAYGHMQRFGVSQPDNLPHCHRAKVAKGSRAQAVQGPEPGRPGIPLTPIDTREEFKSVLRNERRRNDERGQTSTVPAFTLLQARPPKLRCNSHRAPRIAAADGQFPWHAGANRA